ncbi:hypothetical protein NP493_16g06041 [Ridgeia piscesae]|uniref:Uncharacterized protein n=1 Tax=Ridgeia piscesae TaxID=27915 RepID=A0AAD9PES1_RIDPI|nr:hypothetical protein NP493_16g06041 [Ridgeia piscesae]
MSVHACFGGFCRTYLINKEKHTQRRSWPKHWNSLVDEYHKIDRKLACKPLREDEEPTPPAIRDTYSYYPWLSLEMDPCRCRKGGEKMPPLPPRPHSVPNAKPCAESLEPEVGNADPCRHPACHGHVLPHRYVCPGESPPSPDPAMQRPASVQPTQCRVLMPDPPEPPDPEPSSKESTPTTLPTWRSPPPAPPSPPRPHSVPVAHSPPMYGRKRRSLNLDRRPMSLISFSEVAHPGIVPRTAAAMVGWKASNKLEVYGQMNAWARPYREIYKTLKWPIESLAYM